MPVKKREIREIEIQAIAAEGKALTRYENRVIFVPWAIPGDVVDLSVTLKSRKYLEGKIIRMHKPSPDRVPPVCEHFGVCGGCRWQMLPYPEQVRFKQTQVADQLKRIGHLEMPEISPILASPHSEFYRNKLEYTFSHRRWLTSGEMASRTSDQEEPAVGFHVSGLFDKVVDVTKCWLQRDPSNQIRDAVKAFAMANGLTFFNLKEQTGLLRNLIIRTVTTGELMILLSFAENRPDEIGRLMAHLRESFPEANSLLYVINPKSNDTILDLPVIIYAGRDHIFEEIDGLRFKIGPKSFFQSHTAQASILFRKVLEMAELTGDETLYDLYTGTGTIALYLARHCRKVVGVESVPEAIHDAEVNARLNGIENVKFITGDMKEVLSDELLHQEGKPDVMVLDPPRSGMHPQVTDAVLRSGVRRIVYVSCNPATQARDLAMLAPAYRITAVQPLDLFPHTHHVENIVSLDIRPAP